MAKYSLLKGIVSHLYVEDDPKELRADDIGLLAIISLAIVGMFEAIGALIGALTAGSITLEGKSFQCYVGRKKVKGKLEHISFKNGDYVEMAVKQLDVDLYQSYAVRMPQYHALYFPRSVGITTLTMLKYISIVLGVISLLAYFVLITMMYIQIEMDISDFIIFTMSNIFMYFFMLILLFLSFGGRHSFISNRIYATLGYPKSWLHNSAKEHDRFKKLNRSEDPELYDDPQTPEFQRIKKLDPHANYYCRTPILPNWVKVIDERGFIPEQTKQKYLKIQE
jgi:hypothetical protein